MELADLNRTEWASVDDLLREWGKGLDQGYGLKEERIEWRIAANQYLKKIAGVDQYLDFLKEGKALAGKIAEINRENGWDEVTPSDWSDPWKVPGLLALIHSEVSEAIEAFRHSDRENFQEECADAAIRLIGLCYGLGFDLFGAVAAKLEKNKERGFHHGGKRI